MKHLFKYIGILLLLLGLWQCSEGGEDIYIPGTAITPKSRIDSVFAKTQWVYFHFDYEGEPLVLGNAYIGSFHLDENKNDTSAYANEDKTYNLFYFTFPGKDFSRGTGTDFLSKFQLEQDGSAFLYKNKGRSHLVGVYDVEQKTFAVEGALIYTSVAIHDHPDREGIDSIVLYDTYLGLDSMARYQPFDTTFLLPNYDYFGMINDVQKDTIELKLKAGFLPLSSDDVISSSVASSSSSLSSSSLALDSSL